MKYVLILFTQLLSITLFAQITFSENGAWGMKSENGEVLIPAEYKKLTTFYADSEYIVAGLKEKQWYLLSNMEHLVCKQYAEINYLPWDQGYIYLVGNNFMDIVSLTDFNYVAKNLNATEIEELDAVNEDLCRLKFNKMEGLLNFRTGEVLIETVYSAISVDWMIDEFGLGIIAEKDGVYDVYTIDGNKVCDGINHKISDVDYLDSTKQGILLYTKKYKEGFYNVLDGTYVPPFYDLVVVINYAQSVILTTTKKGDGLYYKGVQIVPNEFELIMASDKDEFVAFGYKDGIEYYIKSNGELVQK